MRHLRLPLLLIYASLLSPLDTGLCRANLAITLQKVGVDGVRISWTGSGTIGGSSAAELQDVLSFNNFDGGLYGPAINDPGEGLVYSLSAPLSLTGMNAAMTMSYNNTYESLRLDNETADDLDLLSGTNFAAAGGQLSLQAGDSYEASGSTTVTGLSFSDLMPGTYEAFNTSGDTVLFGGVTLNITAVPEPSGLLFGGVVCGLLAMKKRFTASTNRSREPVFFGSSKRVLKSTRTRIY